MLTAEQVASYHENGFVIPDYRLADATLAALRSDVEALIGDVPERRQLVSTMFDYYPGFIEYTKDPVMLDMIEQIAGPDFALWNMSLFGKPAGDGKKVPWHQDAEYWPIRPMATTRIWIALDAATRENGCLRYVRGSHRRRRIYRHQENSDRSLLLHYEIPAADIDPADIYDLVLEAGQMALHDIYMVHGSEANTTDKVRRAIVINYMPTSSYFDHALAKRQVEEMDIAFDHSRRPLFLIRGTDRCGRNDFEIGHDTLGASRAAE